MHFYIFLLSIKDTFLDKSCIFYVIATNDISELLKTKPNANVLKWFDKVPEDDLYLSVLTLGEIRKGIEKISDPHKKEKLRIWLEHDLSSRLGKRILSIDQSVADCWGRLQGSSRHLLPVIDGLIAATAVHFNLSLVMRNVGDFKLDTLQVINPWNF